MLETDGPSNYFWGFTYPFARASYGLLTRGLDFFFKETFYLVRPLTGIVEFAISLQ